MSNKKDALRQAMGDLSHKVEAPAFRPVTPISLDEQPNGQNSVNNEISNINAQPPRKNVKVKLPKRKWGVQNTSRYSFEITDELKEKLNRRVAEIQLTTGKKISASEIIRQALARELREL